MLETLPSIEAQQTSLKALLAESRQLCVEAIEAQTATQILLRKSRLLLQETKQLYETLESTVKRTGQLCRHAHELQIEMDYWHRLSEWR